MLELPASTIVNRVVSKEQIYRHSQLSTVDRERYIEQIAKIRWTNKIAPDTVPIAAGQYDELEVFEIELRTDNDRDILRLLQPIDEVIPYPILFHIILLSGSDEYIIAYKTVNQNNENRAVVHEYFISDWLNRVQLTMSGTTVDQIYANFIHQIAPSVDVANYNLADAIQRHDGDRQIKRQIERLRQQMMREPSSARCQELALECAKLRKQL